MCPRVVDNNSPKLKESNIATLEKVVNGWWGEGVQGVHYYRLEPQILRERVG